MIRYDLPDFEWRVIAPLAKQAARGTDSITAVKNFNRPKNCLRLVATCRRVNQESFPTIHRAL